MQEPLKVSPEWIIIGANVALVLAFLLVAFIGGSVLNSIRKERKEKNL